MNKNVTCDKWQVTGQNRSPLLCSCHLSLVALNRFWLCTLLAGMGALARAADTNSPPPMTPQQFFEGGTNVYTDWIELSTGGFLTHGNQPQAEEIQHWNAGAFGGIEDLHIQGNAFTNTILTLDGHSIFDQHDYDLKLRLEHPEKWFLQLHFDNFRTWSDNIGGLYPPTGMLYVGSSSALALDRGEFSLEGGLTPKKLPAINFKYTHSYRDGDKSSTLWGPVHPDPLNSPSTVRGLYPSFYDIDETVDAFDLNAKKQIKKTNLGLGLHYEHGELNDGLNATFYQGEQPIPDYQNYRTESQKNTYDLFSVNATSETWLKKNLMLTAGGMFANLDNNFSGSQIYGNSFGAAYSPSPINGFGYYGMTGDSHLKEYVMDLNLLAIPTKTFTITPAIRVQKETWDADSTGTGTLNDNPTEPFDGQSSRDMISVTESLNMRYTGVTNWVFSAGRRMERERWKPDATGRLEPDQRIWRSDRHQCHRRQQLAAEIFPRRPLVSASPSHAGFGRLLQKRKIQLQLPAEQHAQRRHISGLFHRAEPRDL